MFSVKAGKVDDRQPVLDIVENLTGSLYVDKEGINYVTGQCKNMKPKSLSG
ncbi:hypothetical protein [Catenovulum adriaticum]|uniref:Transposase n=1 Tax=Catenovulum adriaticum TaxID=2984846 RepID=A0ABY7ASU2_9ALTE|nr:hypothetical protein [Catenovulum sp. TS8]WAJ71746.1 transposase [Catenovulum sp. TS8]